MQLLSLAEARRFLWNQCSSVPFTDEPGEAVDEVNVKLNLACERFFSSGTWRGTLERAVITAYDNQITLPRELQTILGAKNDYSCPLNVRPIWYELVGGSCCLDGWGVSGLNDLGEGFCTFRDIPSDLPLVIRCNEDVESEAVLTLVVRNGDGTAQITVSLGEAATQINDPLTGTILRANKPVTEGRVELFYVENGVEVKCGMMRPSETDANYRRYRISSSSTNVTAICKRAFVPAFADIEPIIPNNIGALKLMVMSVQFEDKNDFERARAFRDDAVALADADRQQFDGDNQVPIFRVTPGFGAASISQLDGVGLRDPYRHYG